MMNGNVHHTIQDMPNRVLRTIFSFLPLADRATIDQVCRRWRTISNSMHLRCAELNSALSVWGENARTPGEPDVLRMDLLGSMMHRFWQNLTEIDFWHPNASEIPPPPGSYQRSEMLNVPRQAIATLTEYCYNLLDLSLCSCVVPFNAYDLKELFTNSQQLKFLSIRADLTNYDFFQELYWRPMTVIRLDLPTMDFGALVGSLARFRYLRMLTINFPGADVSRHYLPSAWESCRYSINPRVDVMASCR